MRRLACLVSPAAVFVSLALTLVVAACSDDSGAEDASAGNTEDSSGDGDGDGDSTGDGDPGDGDPGECADPDPEVGFSYGFGGFSALNDPEPNVDWTCSIRQLDTSNGLSVELDCEGAPEFIVITISATPGFTSALTGGETIHLRYLSFMIADAAQTYLRLDVEGGGNVLTLIDADTIEAPAEYGFEHFTAITIDTKQCTPVSYFCGTRDRITAGFDLGGDSPDEALDGQHQLIGPPPGVDVWMEEAYVNVTECMDEPAGKARVLIVHQDQQ